MKIKDFIEAWAKLHRGEMVTVLQMRKILADEGRIYSASEGVIAGHLGRLGTKVGPGVYWLTDPRTQVQGKQETML